VSLFLLIFDRDKHTVDVTLLGDRETSLETLFKAEATIRDHPEREIVLLTADDEDDLRRTHARYFESFDELLETA
jgi:hypothetical protein